MEFNEILRVDAYQIFRIVFLLDFCLLYWIPSSHLQVTLQVTL